MIRRSSNIAGKGTPAIDLMGNLIKYAKITGAMPLLDGWSAHLGSISVERAECELIERVLSI